MDETPDEYVADLPRLLALAGYATPNDDKDAIVVEQLLSGLPKNYAKELRLSCAGKEKTVFGCLARACIAGRGWRLSCWPGHDRCCCCRLWCW